MSPGISQHTSIAFLKAKSDQGVPAASQQHLVCVGFLEGAPLNADGGEVQWKGGKGLEDKMSRGKIGQRQCSTKTWGNFWNIRNCIE